MLVLAALFLPVQATARWLGGAHGVRGQVIVEGVWILKGALVAVAAAVVLLRLLARRDASRANGPPAMVAPAPGDDHTVYAALGSVLLLSGVLRLMHLDAGLWLDEIDTLARYVTLRVPQILSTYDSQNQHPLYTLLAHASYTAGGGREWTIRLPAALFGVASIWAAFAFARQITSRAEALLATLVLSVSYHHVWFSQNARGYTAILFFSLATTGIFFRLTRNGNASPLLLVWAYAALMALAAYTNLTAALVAAGHGLALLIGTSWGSAEGRRAARWPAVAIVLSALLTVTCYALVLPQVVAELSTPTMQGLAVEWTSPWWLVTETVRGLSAGVPGGLVTLAVVAVVFGAGMVSYWRQSRMLVLVMCCPVVVTAAVMLALQHNLWPRFFFFSAAFVILLALRGGFVMARWLLRDRAEIVAVTGGVVLAALSALMVPRAWQPKQQFSEAAGFVERERAPGDSVVALGVAAHVYQLRGPRDWQFSSDGRALSAVEKAATRTWVLYTFPTHLGAIDPGLLRQVQQPPYREMHVFPATVRGGEIHVLLNDSRSVHD